MPLSRTKAPAKPTISTTTYVLKDTALLRRAHASLGRFEQLPNVTLRLTPDEHWLLHWMLANPEDFTIPVRDLYRLPSFSSVGMGRDRVRQAAAGLAEKGYYSYWSERGDFGRVYRVRAVTPVPNVLPKPTVSGFLVSPLSHLLSSEDAAQSPGRQPRPGERPAETRPPQGNAAAQSPGRQPRPGERPAETRPPQGNAAAQPPGRQPRPGERPAETRPPQGNAAAQPPGRESRPGERPAELIDWSGIPAARGVDPSRAPARYETYIPKEDLPSVVEQRSQGHPDGEGGQIELRHQMMARDVMTRLPAPLRMRDERDRHKALPVIAAAIRDGATVAQLVAELSRNLPTHFASRPGFIADRLGKFVPPPSTPVDVHAASISERGIFAAGQRPGAADDQTAREHARQAREALKQQRGAVPDKRSGA